MSRVVVFDIDGTLADNDHRRYFIKGEQKDWKVYNLYMKYDGLHEDVASILWSLHDSGDTVVLCTGREITFRPTTWMWLEEMRLAHKVSDVYFRPAKDYRPDSVVKVELLREIEKDYGRPYLWFDDRKQVVDALRAEGIRVLQVAPGDF